VRRLLGSLVAASAFLAAATPSIAAAPHCRTSDYAMQCVNAPSATLAAGVFAAARVAGAAQSGVYKYQLEGIC